jgi:hypothetical protein
MLEHDLSLTRSGSDAVPEFHEILNINWPGRKPKLAPLCNFLSRSKSNGQDLVCS